MLILAATVFAVVAVLTALYIPLALRLQQLDRPSGRSAHTRPTLSSGGVAVVGGWLAVLGVASVRGELALGPRELWVLVLVALLCAVGLVDDRRPLPVSLRMALFLAISAVLAWLYLPFSGLLVLACVTVALCWLVNLYNFMDGIDGIAALQCVLVATALALLAWLRGAEAPYIATALATAAAYGAFLLFNWPPARLFMGDAGSLSAGFVLGWLGLWGVTGGFLCPWCWAALMSPFLLDTGLTLLLRLLRRERITEAHSVHVYQRLARAAGSHAAVDLGLLLLHLLWLLPLSIAHETGRISTLTFIPLILVPQLILIAKTSRLQ